MSGWEPESSPEQWSDTESWRGDVHHEGDDGWRGETLAMWDDEDETADSDSEDDWRGKDENSGWPEDLAGPEYWLYKRDGM